MSLVVRARDGNFNALIIQPELDKTQIEPKQGEPVTPGTPRTSQSQPGSFESKVDVNKAAILRHELLGSAIRLTSAGVDFRLPSTRPDLRESEAERLSRMASTINPFLKEQTKAPLYAKGKGDANEVDMNDIQQGNLGDCYVLSAVAALAQKDPEAIKKMIHDNGDGTYTVTFKERVPGTGMYGPPQYIDRKITVTADFPGGTNGSKHASPGDANAIGNKEIWPLIIEKAYAQMKGGYDKVGGGGSAGDVMEAMTGRPSSTTSPGFLDWPGLPESGFDSLKREFDSGKMVVFGSPKNLSFIPANDGPLDYNVVKNHAYTVKSMYTDENGKQWVELYNPWGTNQPAPVPWDEVKDNFNSVYTN